MVSTGLINTICLMGVEVLTFVAVLSPPARRAVTDIWVDTFPPVHAPGITDTCRNTAKGERGSWETGEDFSRGFLAFLQKVSLLVIKNQRSNLDLSV